MLSAKSHVQFFLMLCCNQRRFSNSLYSVDSVAVSNVHQSTTQWIFICKLATKCWIV